MPVVGVALAFTLVVVLCSSSAMAARKALLVGVGKYHDPKARLDAPAGDVALMKEFLQKNLGFQPGDIATLTDDQATCANIIGKFEDHLTYGTRPGDRVVFYFSGRGGFATDLDGDEVDGFDEMLCPVDVQPNRPETWLTDDGLRRLYAALEGRKILTVLDCCHTGHPEGREISKAKFLDLGFRGSFDKGDGLSGRMNLLSRAPGTDHAMLLASSAGLPAYELRDGSASMFTKAFAAAAAAAGEESSLQDIAMAADDGLRSLTQENPGTSKQHADYTGSVSQRISDFLAGPTTPVGTDPNGTEDPDNGDIPRVVEVGSSKPASSGEIEAIRRDCVARVEAAKDIKSHEKRMVCQHIENSKVIKRILVVPFGTSKGSVPAEYRTKIKQVTSRPEIQRLINDPNAIFVCLGFADKRGRAELNRVLSLNRAKSVMNFLKDGGGMKDAVLHSVAMGGTTMLDPVNLDKNRVVEVWVGVGQ